MGERKDNEVAEVFNQSVEAKLIRLEAERDQAKAQALGAMGDQPNLPKDHRRHLPRGDLAQAASVIALVTCANCGGQIGPGEDRFEFESDDMETWCAECGGDEARRREEAEIEMRRGEIDRNFVQRVWEGEDMQWHFELLTRGGDPEVVAHDSEGYEDEQSAWAGLTNVKDELIERMRAGADAGA